MEIKAILNKFSLNKRLADAAKQVKEAGFFCTVTTMHQDTMVKSAYIWEEGTVSWGRWKGLERGRRAGSKDLQGWRQNPKGN